MKMALQRRKPRISRFRRSLSNEPQPKFKVGDTAGEFNVISYLGHSAIRPDKLKILGQEHHWYRVRCSCVSKTEEIHSQQQLVDTRRQRVCGDCLTNIRKNDEYHSK